MSPVATYTVPSLSTARSQMYFVFGSKKTEDWPAGRHFVNFSVGRSADEQIPGGIEGERLGREFRRIQIRWSTLPLASMRSTFAFEPPAA